MTKYSLIETFFHHLKPLGQDPNLARPNSAGLAFIQHKKFYSNQ